MDSKEEKLVAKREGKLDLGGMIIECYHLNDTRRVITQRSFTRTIGIKGKAPNDQLITLLDNPTLKTKKIISLKSIITNPIKFKTKAGGTTYGYEGDVLIEYCKAILYARSVGALSGEVAMRYARSCEGFIVACAKVGILALIDEATGYSTDKKRDEYRKIFQEFIREQHREWEKEFPDQFFELIYKLYDIKKENNNHPQFFGNFIRKYVYEPLANSKGAILEMLDEKNPVVYSVGGRKYKMHQFLSDEVGVDALRSHIQQIIGIARAASKKDSFDRLFKKAFPKIGDQGELDFIDYD